jgi:cellulose synthase/poly-beta-1,6-N-acetylglucosamine synthase-like glycosyltransferase
MRKGFNPYKDQPIEKSENLHQIIIPVFIPHFVGYFKDSFAILKLCLQSVFSTVHDKTFITIVNNGSCDEIKNYLNELHNQNRIHEIIHTTNIGKLNAILKGLAGNAIELVTISDSDVLFLKGWQQETTTIFKELPKVGVVGIVPQFNMHKINCNNIVFDNFFNSKLQFIKVKNEVALSKFYESIGWDENYNHDYLKYTLALTWNSEITVLVGSGHFVATYKKDVFSEIVNSIPYKMGGNSESYLDELPLKKDYWRVTTNDNYAYHMGNSLEKWMTDVVQFKHSRNIFLYSDFTTLPKISKLKFILKNKILQKLLKQKYFYHMFLKFKKLPTEMIDTY